MLETTNHLSNEDLAGYALKSLSPPEARAVEAHLSGCAECQAKLANYEKVADGLLFAMPPQSPPAGLRARLAANVAASRRPAAAAPRPRLRWSWALAIQALVLVALLAANVFQAIQIQDLQNREALLLKALSENQAVVAIAAQPGVSVLPLETNRLAGSLLVSADQLNGVVIVKGLEVLDAAHTYQMWLIPAKGSPLSAGLFEARAGQSAAVAVFSSTAPIKGFAAFGITIEPAAGSVAPTTQPILLGNF